MRSETVTRIRAGQVVDPYSGDNVGEDWANTDDLDLVTLAPPEPLNSSEPAEIGRASVGSGWRLYLREGADITSQDRIRVRGNIYPVVGEPMPWAGAGVVVQVARTEG